MIISDDIEALGIFNNARSSNKFCCLAIYSDFDYCWEIKWVLAEAKKHKEQRTHCHDTLLEAIKEFQVITRGE